MSSDPYNNYYYSQPPPPNFQGGYGQPGQGSFYHQQDGNQGQSSYPPGQSPFQPNFIPGMDQLNPMFTNMAKQYGESLVGQGQDMMNEKVQKFVSVSKLKYYFAVDTNYVVKKLSLLFFPFLNKDWSIHFDKNEDDGIQPRYEINTPDLYIPLMGFVTYILMAGLSLGMQEKFSPEILGMQSSTALGWLLLELMIFKGCVYIIPSDLKLYDLIAFCSYKFVGMIFALIGSMILGRMGYYFALIYYSLSLCVFLFQSLKSKMNSYTIQQSQLTGGTKRRFYLISSITVAQPILMWWLSYHVAYW